MIEKVFIAAIGLVLFGIYLTAVQHGIFSKSTLGYIGLFLTLLGCINFADSIYHFILFILTLFKSGHQ